jgi:hypothetical protein
VPLTTITENKSEFGVVFGFIVVVLGLAAIRGAEGAPILAGAMGIAAVGILLGLFDLREVERACVAHGWTFV